MGAYVRIVAALFGALASLVVAVSTSLWAAETGGTTLPTELVVGIIILALTVFAASYGWIVTQLVNMRSDLSRIKGKLGIED